jgi:hypothetical protein
MLRTLLPLLLLAAPAALKAQDAQRTRYGTLRVNADHILLFNGRPVRPRVEGNSSLEVKTVYHFRGYDLALVEDIGGSGCPALYHVVRLSPRGAIATGEFGTCSDLIRVTRTAAGLRMTMPGFMGPTMPASVRDRAARRTHVFLYANGRVTENGRPVR